MQGCYVTQLLTLQYDELTADVFELVHLAFFTI